MSYEKKNHAYFIGIAILKSSFLAIKIISCFLECLLFSNIFFPGFIFLYALMKDQVPQQLVQQKPFEVYLDLFNDYYNLFFTRLFH